MNVTFTHQACLGISTNSDNTVSCWLLDYSRVYLQVDTKGVHYEPRLNILYP